MAILAEVLGFIIPGTSTIPAGDVRAHEGARSAGARVAQCALRGESPFLTCGPASFRNALRLLNAIGGSTNAVLHLAALAGRLGVDFDLGDVDRLGRHIPVIADVEPTGTQLIGDLDAAGGVPALLRVLGDLLETEPLLADGRATGDVAAAAPAPMTPAIRSRTDPVCSGGAFRVVRGTLAPQGALLKRSSASTELLRHRGRALVFHGYEDMRARVEDPGLDVDASSVLVLAGCGPVGGPGMPEWGMIPIPRKLLEVGVRDMVRVTDARMSGTSYGTVYLHAAPEAAVGGPLALVRDGDVIDVDADAGRLDLLVEPEELARRAASWRPPAPPSRRGWTAFYQAHVTQAPRGCDFKLLEPVPGEARLVEPVVGRS
jgi:dihydroxy-acid dehydratase